MLYSRLLAPWLLWLVLMLTNTAVRNISTVQCLGLSETRSKTTNNCDKSNISFNPRNECEPLSKGVIDEICRTAKWDDWRNVSLNFCGRPLSTTVSEKVSDFQTCNETLHRLLVIDTNARQAAISFRSILDRFDCLRRYSVKFSCDECKAAYQDWVCSDYISYYYNSRKIKPCRSFCRRVEQTCPFFLPLDKLPAHYAGEPTFLCLDPNIEETVEQQENSSFGPNSCCYEECEPGGLCKVRGGATCIGDDDTERSTTSNDIIGDDNGAAHLAETASLAAAVFLAFLLLVNRTRLRVM